MRLFWIIVIGLVVLGAYLVGQQNNQVYNECLKDGIHTEQRCFELAYM